ncbi:NAD-dependent epimerase/dehydratase family protein [Solimonas terrae]|uniref:SDR family NAD(P)-dependent oxidoreductase n=1 Tax=Solimonas terrae TaxID=1396819 RepID=A0A6M2BN23_9GAMM|nr:SDR family NAD(P)-dependent oxidoreductase [Solimonas terrae]
MPPEAGPAANAPVVAVTGATGFIGRHLVPALARAGWQVRILVRRDPAGTDWRDLGIESVAGDLRDREARRQLVRGADAVVHLAGLIKAPDTAGYMAVNRDATRALCESIREHTADCPAFYISSLAAREPALSSYAASKRAGEDEMLHILGAKAEVLRPAAVYGPGDRETLIFFQLARLARVPLLGSDRARISVIQVEDLCAAIVSALQLGPHGRVSTICDARAEGYCWRELMQAAAAAIGRADAGYFRLPPAVLQGLALIGDIGHRFGSHQMLGSEKLRELLFEDWTVPVEQRFTAPRWQARFALADGFAHAAAWYRQAGWLAA